MQFIEERSSDKNSDDMAIDEDIGEGNMYMKSNSGFKQNNPVPRLQFFTFENNKADAP